MEPYDFDTIVNRKNTMSLKYDAVAARGIPEDCLPLWVADMDFGTAPEIRAALAPWVIQGIFGYALPSAHYRAAVVSWMGRRYGYDLDPNAIVTSPSVVFALATAIRAFTAPGDAVLIQQPVYHPFKKMIESNGRRMVSNDLILDGCTCHMDLVDLEEKIRRHGVKLFLFCHPHNPMGRVWQISELQEVGELCKRYGVTVVSDEIHADLTWTPEGHTMLCQACPALAQQIITCTSPSKTFNLAGLQIANILIPNQKMRDAFQAEKAATGYGEENILGLVACEAAYQHGEDWYQALRTYLMANLREAVEKLNQSSMVKTTMPGATYLLWLDLRNTGLEAREINRKLLQEAKVWLNDGRMFSEKAAGFFRLNAACPKQTLEEGVARILHTFR